eukprot:2480405-Rhodomonas_salina.1
MCGDLSRYKQSKGPCRRFSGIPGYPGTRVLGGLGMPAAAYPEPLVPGTKLNKGEVLEVWI